MPDYHMLMLPHFDVGCSVSDGLVTPRSITYEVYAL
jgi:hypothetical protein